MDEHLGTELSPNRTVVWIVAVLAVVFAVPLLDMARQAAEERGSRALLAWLGTAVVVAVVVVLPLALVRFALRHHTWVSDTAIAQELGTRRRVLRLDELDRVVVRRGVSRLGMGPFGNRTMVMSGAGRAIRVSTFFVRDLGPLLEALHEEARRRPALRAATDDRQLFDEMLAISRSR